MDQAVVMEQARETWDQVEYADNIKYIMTGSVRKAAVLLLEAKKKFFLDKDKHWAKFVKENIGISRQTAYELERIAVRLIPVMDEGLFADYGKSKLSEISKVEDRDDINTALTIVNPTMKLVEIKEKLAPFIVKKQPPKKFKSGSSVAKQLYNLNDVMTDFLLEKDDTDKELERKRKNIGELREQGHTHWDSLRNVMDFLMADDKALDIS